MDIDELRFKTNEIQEEIIYELAAKGPRLVSELREDIGKDRFKEGSRGHHPDKLEEWGMIEVVAREGPHNERRFGLTDLGVEYLNQKRKGWNTGTMDDKLEERITKLEQETIITDEVQRRINELEQRVEEQQAQIERLSEEKVEVSRFERLTDHLGEEYINEIVRHLRSEGV